MATKLEIEEAARRARESSAAQESQPDDIWKPEPANLEDELLSQQEDEEEQNQMSRYEEQKQIDRMNAQNAREEEQKQNSLANQATTAAGNYAKTAAKTVIKDVAYEAAASTAPIWGTIIAIILLVAGIIGALVIVVVSVKTVCDGGYTDSTQMAGLKLAVAWLPGDVCAQLATEGGRSGGAGAASNTLLDITITSAYRRGSIVAGTGRLSAHSRGEAVDIALRNPSVAEFSNDPRIAQLVQIAKSVGFTPTVGDTLDEYTKPTEGATAGHIHVEFNLKPDGTTYCDGAKIPNSGPTDLVSLVGQVSVDTGSTSDPRVRPCMLDAVNQIFNLAGYSP